MVTAVVVQVYQQCSCTWHIAFQWGGDVLHQIVFTFSFRVEMKLCLLFIQSSPGFVDCAYHLNCLQAMANGRDRF